MLSKILATESKNLRNGRETDIYVRGYTGQPYGGMVPATGLLNMHLGESVK